MTDDNSNNELVDIDNDLNAFTKEFYGETAEETVEDENVEEVSEEDDLATDDDEGEDQESEDNESEDEDEEEIDTTPRGKRNRKSYQERLNEIYADKKAAEREVEVLRRELELARSQKEVKQEQAPIKAEAPKAPTPDDVDEKGEPLYPLGEIDPKYIANLTRFTVMQEMEADRVRRETEAQQKAIQEQQTVIQQHWLENLSAAEEEIPDIREEIASMVQVFQNIEPNYGEYLAGTIMSCDNGPEIMYYLSQNIGEAQKIVASGPAAATLAIGRLEAQLSKPKQEELKRNKRVSETPPPPEQRTRGVNGRFATRPDTRDLAAFSKEFFKDQ